MADPAQDSKEVKTVHLESVAAHDNGRYSSEADAARGAAILEEENQFSLWYNAKLHWRALLICSFPPLSFPQHLTDKNQAAPPSQLAWHSATTPL
jgi:hypothetical protein